MIHPNDFPKSKLISTNNIQLEVFEAGQQHTAKPIVLCHGWPEHAYSWRYQIPALVDAGYHVIVPNQRGYGNSSRPTEIENYDINHLSADLIGLLDHYGYEKATFVGHDWGASIVWWLTLLHPERVDKVINLALPYQERGNRPWLEFMQEFLGEDYYFVHFNQQPGVADAILDKYTSKFLKNLFRKNLPLSPPQPGMMMINLAQSNASKGEAIMNDEDLEVFISSFKKSGFTSSINWYRNLNRNWHLLKDVNPIIKQKSLMIYGKQDLIPKFDKLSEFVPNVTEVSLDCGHWIQQEMPNDTNQVILNWLEQQDSN